MNLCSNPDADQSSAARQQWCDAGCQRGSIAIMAAICLSIMVILLSSIDIGYLFYMKRDLQKVADLAALAGAQQLVSTMLTGNPATCAATDPPAVAAIRLAAIGNAQMNGFSDTAPNTMSNAIYVNCGRWDPSANATLTPSFFLAPPAANTRLNAVQVILTQNVPAFFGLSSRTISAQAIASTSDPYAAFSVGSNLLQVKNGVVPNLLSALGLNLVGTSLVTYNGLANVSVTPSGLLQALGFQIPLHASVGTVTQLLNVNTAGCSNGVCTLQALLGAVSVVGSQQNLISALGLTAGQLNLPVRLLSIPGGAGGLFTLLDAADGQAALNAAINAADGESALNVKLSALDIVSTAVAVANSSHALAASVSLPGALTTQIGIVEPPSIGIGGIGTTAFTAQVRLYTRIQASALGLITIDLPIIIDVVNGLGQLTDMCTTKDSSGNDRATIQIDAPVLSICAGQFNGAVNGSTAFSTTGACKKNLTAYPQMVTVLGIPLINQPIAVDGLPNSQPVQLIKGQTTSTGSNNLQIGTTVSNLLKALTAAIAGDLLGGAVGLLTDLLQPILDGLGAPLSQLLTNLLGAQIGTVDVKLLDLSCGGSNVKLVY